ncbi:MAG: hypothetical protein QFE16_10790 [Pseudomonadota bacterium]|nr:hypothetical protein [Pseudomonadota bacterium]
MSAAVKARSRGRCIALCAVAWGLSASAHAELWTIENSVQSRFELNDNVTLSRNSPGTVNTLSLSNTLNAARQMENSATHVNASFNALRQRGNGGNDRIDGQLGLTQSLTDPLNEFSVSGLYSQDFNNVVQNADVTVGRGLRRTQSLSANWSRAITELLSASTQVSTSLTGYGKQVSGAAGFTNTSVSASLSYRLTETDTMSVQLSHSDYRADASSNHSQTNFVSVGMSRSLTERVSASLNLGLYRTENSVAGSRVACPLEISLCRAGLVPYILVRSNADTAANGLQYSSTYNYRFDESSSFSFATGTQQTPSGAGAVTRGQSLSLGATHAFSETLSGSMGYALSRSKFQGTSQGGTASQRSFSMSMSKQLAPELSLQTAYQWSQANNVGAGNTAQSNSVSVSLKYDWSRIDATR